MYGVLDNSTTLDDDASSAFIMLFLLAGVTLALSASLYKLACHAESGNHFNYESRFARILAGTLLFIVNKLHTTEGDMQIPDGKNALIAAGPHRTGWEALVLASKMKGTPPQFYATTAYNAIPGVASFLKMFKAIPIEPSATKDPKGRSANSKAHEFASKELKNKGCVAIFPQGNFSRPNQEPPIIYPGTAKLAVQNKIPVHVIRLDNFRCLESSYIPLFISNNALYRAFFSFFSVNNIRTSFCEVIDFHLQPENEHLRDEEKIEEINARLYAYFRHTKTLSAGEVAAIKEQIGNNKHQPFWANRMKQESLKKQILSLKEEESILEQSLLPS